MKGRPYSYLEFDREAEFNRNKGLLKTCYYACEFKKARDRMRYLFSRFPEYKKCTHDQIGWLLHLARETVTRNMKLL